MFGCVRLSEFLYSEYQFRSQGAAPKHLASQGCYSVSVRIRPTRLAKANIVLFALGLFIFLAVAIWLKSTRTILADIPVPMSSEVVTRNFIVDYDGPLYRMVVRFDPRVPEATARCLLGATKSDLRPDLDCSGTSPLLKFSWELRRDGQSRGSGSSADMGSISTMDGASRVIIVGFPAQKKHRYEVALKFERNAATLSIPPPRVQIELDYSVREGLFFAGAALDTVAIVLCLIGVVIFVVQFLKAKFNRFKAQPEPR
jgi:hypothetical protein